MGAALPCARCNGVTMRVRRAKSPRAAAELPGCRAVGPRRSEGSYARGGCGVTRIDGNGYCLLGKRAPCDAGLLDAQDQVKAERGFDDRTELSDLQLEGGVGERRRDGGTLDGADASVAGFRTGFFAIQANNLGE